MIFNNDDCVTLLVPNILIQLTQLRTGGWKVPDYEVAALLKDKLTYDNIQVRNTFGNLDVYKKT